VGIATGVASGLVVFDIDPRNGGDASFEQLKRELPGAFEHCPEVRTGSGGGHYYFQCSDPMPSRANIRPGIDVKADGGYVVAPSSFHACGGRYRFISNSGQSPSPLPPSLRNLILPEAQAQQGGQARPIIQVDSLQVSSEIKTTIRDGKPRGQRSEAIFAAIRAMLKAGSSDDEIIAVLSNPANGLSEKPREKGDAWLVGEIGRARAKPDRNNGSAPPSANESFLVLRKAADIHPEAICWLWPGRIALGKICLIAGPPGLGKSQVTTDIAATVSSGGIWITGEKSGAGDVLFFSAEDDPADTIRPRLEACGANLDRVHIIEAISDKRRERSFSLKSDLEALSAALTARPDVKLIIIDPISAYLGGIDSHNNSDVRGLIAPLAKLAADHGAAVVSVTHLNKGQSDDPVARIMGSTAFIAAVRTAFLVQQDPLNHELRLFLPLKSNISSQCSGLAFRIQAHNLPSGIETSRILWDAKPVTITAREALSPSTADEIDDATGAVEASRRIFQSEKASELRASRLVELIKKREDPLMTAKRLKKLLALCGIHQHKRSDANYYVEGDFVAAAPPSPTMPPPSMSKSTVQE
jgi:hypothetical protein